MIFPLLTRSSFAFMLRICNCKSYHIWKYTPTSGWEFGISSRSLLSVALSHTFQYSYFPSFSNLKTNTILTILSIKIVHCVHYRKIKMRVWVSNSFFLYCFAEATVILRSFTDMRKYTCSLALPTFHRHTLCYQTTQLDKPIILYIKFLNETIF